MKRWQVFSAVALRRLPELMPQRDPIELKVQQIFQAWEDSKSRYSAHEVQHLEDLRIKKSEQEEIIVKETAQDREDRWVLERSTFQTGEYDDKSSKTHYLFTKCKFGTDTKDQWLLPQAMFDRKLGDENLVDTARRALKESLDIINGYRIISKLPSSVYTFRYPKKIMELTGHYGARVFFIKANLDMPDNKVLDAIDSSKNDKLKWVTRDEAQEIVNKKYMTSFSQGLLHENRVDVDKVLEQATRYAQTISKMSVKV